MPYRGGGPAANDLLGGHITMAFLSLSSAVPQLPTGKIRIVALVEKTRYAAMPDVPTIGETVPGFEMSSWLGVFAPAGTPAPLIARLNDTIDEDPQRSAGEGEARGARPRRRAGHAGGARRDDQAAASRCAAS